MFITLVEHEQLNYLMIHLTLGVDIETGGHVFQLLFSNAQSTNEPGFIK